MNHLRRRLESYSKPFQFGSRIPVPLLKHHFNVSNLYVIRKLQLVLFPWRHKRWTRANRPGEQGQAQWLPPRDDINSPDLYIPGLLFLPSDYTI